MEEVSPKYDRVDGCEDSMDPAGRNEQGLQLQFSTVKYVFDFTCPGFSLSLKHLSTMSPRKVSDWVDRRVHRSYKERLPGVGRMRKNCFSPEMYGI